MMRRMLVVAVCVCAIGVWQSAGPSQGVSSQVRVQRLSAVAMDDLRGWDARVDRMTRSGELESFQDPGDTRLPGRRHERLRQLYRGIPVWGGDISRQTAGGVTVSIFGTMYEGINVDTAPALSPRDAHDVIRRLSGVDAPRDPDLLILPLDGGGYALAYRGQAISTEEASVYFVDAMNGSLRQKYNLFENQVAVVQGTGVMGDTKKVSVRSVWGTFTADDQLRPPALQTYDMRGNLTAALNALNGITSLTTANLAQDPSTNWTDGANVDGHAYEGFTYDFYFKKFGRRGLDNRNTRINGMTHTVRAQDILQQPASIQGLFYLNAFYCPSCGRDGLGMMVYGEGSGAAFFQVGPTRVFV